MPLYFFDVRDGSGLSRDDIGIELSSLDEVRAQVQILLPDIVREELPDGELHQVSCDARDETGQVVYRGELTYRGTRF